MRRVGVEERRARLARRHRLAEPATDLVEAVRSMVGFHSSDPATPYLSSWARLPDFQVEMLEDALYEERSLLRMLGMRRTMWVVPTEMSGVLHHSSTTALIGPQRRRHVKMIEEGGITDNGAAWTDRVSAATLRVLEERGEATASELVALIPELREKITFYKADGSVQAVSGMSTRILFLLATEGRVVRGRPLGSWLSSQYRWAPMTEWMGHPLADMAPEQADRALLTAWLLAFGPGTELDMKWWSGWPVTKVRETLDAIGAVEVDLEDGAVGFVHRDDVGPAAGPTTWVALLPSLDPTTMGWKERDWYLGDLAGELFDRNGNAGPTVWVDGRIVGGWAQRPDGEVVHEILIDVGNEAAEAVGARAAELGSWLGGVRVTPRFSSPHEKAMRSA